LLTNSRAYHTSLNRLITSRLPLCLPPHAPDSSTYRLGISAFAEIYFAFESQWTDLISPTPPTAIPPRIQTLLRTLYHPPLLRTASQTHDLTLLSHKHPTNHPKPHQQTALTTKITNRIHSRPHTLLAYPWILYLALFNGGRWIRAQLLSSDFWPTPHPAADHLTFWHFDDDHDGEDIKSEFKARFESAAAQLTEAECRDVVEEAVEIFRICAAVVEGLDRAFETEQVRREEEEEGREVGNAATSLSLPLLDGLSGQLYAIFIWMWGVLFASAGKARRGQSPVHGVVLREEVQ
jgi:Heme oxygenase